MANPSTRGRTFPMRHGMPAFRKVLTAIADTWTNRRDEIEEQSSRVVDAIARASSIGQSPETLTDELLSSASRALRSAFDTHWGGFGGAPKFPQPMAIDFLLRRHLRGDPDALDIVRITLDRMAAGGIHDQLGGGFHRYSTDARWLVPHFEKMLYDNALLTVAYLEAFQATGAPFYRQVVEETLDYVLREMTDPAGAFYSSQDADSEGVEGKFFAWSWDELVAVGGEAVATAFGATPSGNWEGTNVLWFPRPVEAGAQGLEID